MESSKKKLLGHFINNVGKYLTIDELAKVAGTHDWQRTIRTLRLNDGYAIEHIKKGKSRGTYIMHSTEKTSGKPRGAIDARIRYRILQRDNSICQRCGRSPQENIQLVVDHKKPVEWGGSSGDDNLWTLCVECNLGKKHWLSDENIETMKGIMNAKSAYKKLELYFDAYPNIIIEPTKLDVISGIRDWERTLRSLRQKSKKNIKYVRNVETGKNGYIYQKS